MNKLLLKITQGDLHTATFYYKEQNGKNCGFLVTIGDYFDVQERTFDNFGQANDHYDSLVANIPAPKHYTWGERNIRTP